MNSYSAANLGISSNNALSSLTFSSIGQPFAALQAQIQPFSTPSASSPPAASAMPFSQNQSFVAAQAASPSNVASSSNGKEGDENLALATGLVNCYNALVAGDLLP